MLLDLASKYADQAEVYQVHRYDTPVQFEANRLKLLETRQSQGIGLRLLHQGRIGISSATHADRPDQLVESALEAASFGPRAQFELPANISGPDVTVYDEEVENAPLEKMIELGQRVIDDVRRRFPEVQFEGSVRRQISEITLANSRGGSASYRKSTFSLSFEGLRIRGTDMLFVGESEADCHVIHDPGDLIDRILQQLEWANQNVAVPSKVMPVLFTPGGAVSTLIGPILHAMNGRTVLQGASPLGQRQGQATFDSRLSIWDDATLSFQTGSAPFDDEGIPSRLLSIVDHGIVGQFMYDLQTAAEAGVSSTGSASRGVDTLPSPSARCVRIATGDQSLADMIQSMDEGIIADQFIGAGQGNTLAGDFGGNLLLGYRVQRGQVTGRVKDTMVSGNAYEALKQVRAISRESRRLGGSMLVPYFLIDGVTVASAAP